MKKQLEALKGLGWRVAYGNGLLDFAEYSNYTDADNMKLIQIHGSLVSFLEFDEGEKIWRTVMNVNVSVFQINADAIFNAFLMLKWK